MTTDLIFSAVKLQDYHCFLSEMLVFVSFYSKALFFL